MSKTKQRKTRLKGTDTKKPCADCGKMKDRFKDFKPRWAGCVAHRTENGRRYYQPGCADCEAKVNGNIRQPRCIACDKARPKKRKAKAKAEAPTPTVEVKAEVETAAVHVDPNPTLPPQPAPSFAEAEPKLAEAPETETVEEPETETVEEEPEVEEETAEEAVTVEPREEPSEESQDVTPEPAPEPAPKIVSAGDLLKLFGDE